MVGEDHLLFLVCSATSIQQPVSVIHFLTNIQILNNPIHPLHDSVLAWAGDLIEDDLPAIIYFDLSYLIPGNTTVLTNIVDFDSTVATLDPTQSLVTPPTSTHTRKRIAIPAAAYIVPKLLPPFLLVGGPVKPTESWCLLCSRFNKLCCKTECLSIW